MFLEEKKTGETQVQEPSLEGFIAWLEKQPADGEYDWINPQKCACAQYAAFLGVTQWSKNMAHDPWYQLNRIAFGYSDTATFGRCLTRAKAALIKEYGL